MSKFSSVALGKVTGSLGNITTSRLKGQQIAKAKITQTTASDSLTQLASKNKMRNTVLAYQFLAGFLSKSGGHRKQTESTYNAFVRGFKSEMTDEPCESRQFAASELISCTGLAGNYAKVQEVAAGASDITVTIQTGGLPWVMGGVCRVITFDSISGENEIVEKLIDSNMWSTGSIVIVPADGVKEITGVYLYSADQKKCSNILFA